MYDVKILKLFANANKRFAIQTNNIYDKNNSANLKYFNLSIAIIFAASFLLFLNGNAIPP